MNKKSQIKIGILIIFPVLILISLLVINNFVLGGLK